MGVSDHDDGHIVYYIHTKQKYDALSKMPYFGLKIILMDHLLASFEKFDFLFDFESNVFNQYFLFFRSKIHFTYNLLKYILDIKKYQFKSKNEK